MDAPSTVKSLPAPSVTGGAPLPLEPVAALPATLTDLPCSAGTLISLSAICTGLLSETLSPDAMFLAMRRAATEAHNAGVDPNEFNRVCQIIERHWRHRRAQNPLSRMF